AAVFDAGHFGDGGERVSPGGGGDPQGGDGLHRENAGLPFYDPAGGGEEPGGGEDQAGERRAADGDRDRVGAGAGEERAARAVAEAHGGDGGDGRADGPVQPAALRAGAGAVVRGGAAVREGPRV